QRDRVAEREDTLKERISEEMDKPRKDRDTTKLRAWREELLTKHAEHVSLNQQLSNMRGEARAQIRARDALDGDTGIIAALTDKQEALDSGYSEIQDNIKTVQGLGGPADHLQTLPPIGTLGGRLFDTQKLIKELTDNPPRITSSATGGETDTRRADLLQD